jgi:hypothetical protein
MSLFGDLPAPSVKRSAHPSNQGVGSVAKRLKPLGDTLAHGTYCHKIPVRRHAACLLSPGCHPVTARLCWFVAAAVAGGTFSPAAKLSDLDDLDDEDEEGEEEGEGNEEEVARVELAGTSQPPDQPAVGRHEIDDDVPPPPPPPPLDDARLPPPPPPSLPPPPGQPDQAAMALRKIASHISQGGRKFIKASELLRTLLAGDAEASGNIRARVSPRACTGLRAPMYAGCPAPHP